METPRHNLAEDGIPTAQDKLELYFKTLVKAAEGNRIISGGLDGLVRDIIIEIPLVGEIKNAAGEPYSALDALAEMQHAYELGLLAVKNGAESNLNSRSMAQEICTLGFVAVSTRIAELSLPAQPPKNKYTPKSTP